MKKNTLENVCVYYKDAGGLRFEKQEHTIPAFSDEGFSFS